MVRRRRSRTVAVLVAVAALACVAGLAIWQARPGGPWHVGGRNVEPVTSSLDRWFAAAEAGNVETLTRLRAEGIAIDATDPFGRTATHLAAAGGHANAVWTLLAWGSDVDAVDASGATPLIAAVKNSDSAATALILANAGADPTIVDGAGRRALDHATERPAIRRTGVWTRLAELTESSPVIDALRDGERYLTGWPSAYVVPIEGATISSRRSHLPGALRAYRNGVHEGFDFYDGTVSVAIEYGTPQRAVADGTVIRADHDYVEFTPATYRDAIDVAASSTSTPDEVLDRLRGRQVWIEHAGGFVSRYAHLSAIPDDVIVGTSVRQGATVAFTGNSGTMEAAEGTQDDPHPHVEIWSPGGSYLGEGLETEKIYALAAQVFGFEALPPFTDGGLTF